MLLNLLIKLKSPLRVLRSKKKKCTRFLIFRNRFYYGIQ